VTIEPVEDIVQCGDPILGGLDSGRVLEREERDNWASDSTSWTRPFFRVHIVGPRSRALVNPGHAPV